MAKTNKMFGNLVPTTIFPQAIPARWGTRANIVNHAFLNGPFSQVGAPIWNWPPYYLVNLVVQWEFFLAVDPTKPISSPIRF